MWKKYDKHKQQTSQTQWTIYKDVYVLFISRLIELII